MFSYSFAVEIAEALVTELKDSCERIAIAGSLRRAREIVYDIDIVAIPKLTKRPDDTLFAEMIDVDLLETKLSQLCFDGQLRLEANGPKIKRFYKELNGELIPIDLYIADEQTWWTTLLIRTGSRNHNLKLARRALDLHMHLKADGSGLLTVGGAIIQINSEEDLFERLLLQYQPPEKRE